MPTQRVSFKGTAGGQEVQNVLHILDTGSGSGTPQDTLNAYSLAWSVTMVGRLASSYVYTGATATPIDPSIQGTESTSGAGTVGPQTGTVLPVFVSLGITLRTATAGRAGRGRTGLSPLTETYTLDTGGTGQVVPASLVADTTLAFQEFIDDIGSTGGVASPGILVVVSTVVGGIPRAAPLVSLVTSFSVASMVGTRLSRKA